MGAEGTPADQRRYSNDQLVQAYDHAEELAKHMDERGFYCMWMAEHHFQHEGYECIPNLILMGVHLAGQTKNLKFGQAFNIIPMWHPLRVAEDFAMADVLTRGRMIFGVGRGYHAREVETFGAPVIDNDANRELFLEQMEVILKAFNEESWRPHGQVLHHPAGSALSRLRPERNHDGAPAGEPARGDLATHRQRAHAELHRRARHQGDGRAHRASGTPSR